MKKLIVLVSVAGLFAAAFSLDVARGADGKELFTTMGCTACHKPDQKLVGSSLKDIAGSYGNADKLLQFLGGGSPQRTNPLPPTMKPFQEKTAKLAEPDRKALADYIMSFK